MALEGKLPKLPLGAVQSSIDEAVGHQNDICLFVLLEIVCI